MSGVLAVSMGIALFGALLAVTLQNVLYAIFGLGLSLLGIAGVFFALGSPFVASMQVLIYVGGITVAMVFAVMLSFALGSATRPPASGRRLFAVVPVALFAGSVGWVLHSAGLGDQTLEVTHAVSVAEMGRALLQHYNLVFEALSLVLLLAIVGAVTVAHRSPQEDDA